VDESKALIADTNFSHYTSS